ncbi:hypothetical protein ACYJ1Y_10095, partial [Natrialbaceae archaeon A-gly3]
SASFAHGPVSITCSQARSDDRSLAPHAWFTLSWSSSVSIESVSVRLVLEYDAEVLHPTHELVCESPRIEHEYLLEGRADDGVETILSYVEGESEPYERTLEAVADELDCVPATASRLLRRGEARLVADAVDGRSVR